jgi:hypothetical protein
VSYSATNFVPKITVTDQFISGDRHSQYSFESLYEADHSPPASAEVKTAWSYISIPPIRLHGLVLI